MSAVLAHSPNNKVFLLDHLSMYCDKIQVPHKVLVKNCLIWIMIQLTLSLSASKHFYIGLFPSLQNNAREIEGNTIAILNFYLLQAFTLTALKAKRTRTCPSYGVRDSHMSYYELASSTYWRYEINHLTPVFLRLHAIAPTE